ncbi:MAG: two-component regulator propeller domain-containing protein [Flavobacteriales bacterium]
MLTASCNGQVATPASRESGGSSVAVKENSAQGERPASYYQNVSCGLQDKAGNMWFGSTSNGVLRYNGKAFTRFSADQGLASTEVFAMLEDKAGTIWVGTKEGVYRSDGRTFMRLPIPHGQSVPEKDGNGVLTNSPDWIISLSQDRTGALWLGTQGFGAYRYDGTSFTFFNEQNGLCGDFVQDIMEDRKGTIWLATRGGGLCRYDGSSPDQSGRGRFTSFTKEQGLDGNIDNNHLTWVLEDRSRKLWFATVSRGLFRYDGKSTVHFTNTDAPGLNNNFDAAEDASGTIWIATRRGVYSYDGTSFTGFTTAEGLCNDDVMSITLDRSGGSWFGTRSNGLCRYDGKAFVDFTERLAKAE